MIVQLYLKIFLIKGDMTMKLLIYRYWRLKSDFGERTRFSIFVGAHAIDSEVKLDLKRIWWLLLGTLRNKYTHTHTHVCIEREREDAEFYQMGINK